MENSSVIDNIIETQTEFSPLDFTGGNIQYSVSKYTKKMRIKLILYFGFDFSRNTISRSFDIQKKEICLFHTALLSKTEHFLSILEKNDEKQLSYEAIKIVVRGDSSGSDSIGNVDRVDSDSDNFSQQQVVTVPSKQEVMEVWNDLANQTGIPKIKSMSETRYKKFKTRIHQNNNFLEDFINTVETAVKSEFIMSSSWFTFDWIVKNNENYLKVLEGNYNGKQ